MKKYTLLTASHHCLHFLVGAWIAYLVTAAGSAWGASRITVEYGLLERSISVDSLEAYANQGTITRDLRDYARSLSPEQLQQLQRSLRAKIELSPVAVSQFLYTEQGEILLQRLGTVIRTDANLSGFYAIRAALILAATDPEGLTLLNVINKFPLDDVRIDVVQALSIVSDLENLVQTSQNATRLVEQQSVLEALAQTKEGTPPWPVLRSPGALTWQMVTLQVNTPHRQRSIPVDLYLPSRLPQDARVLSPVIVISHGLGSDRTTFAYLAKQLASYGFVVAVPEHPGSDAQQLQTLLSGAASQLIEPDEFINRPLDVTAVLDELTRLANADPSFMGRMNLEQVGVVGQSFGGYTALALAGATFDLQQLRADCTDTDSLNPALLLECRVQSLPRPLPNLRDPRVKAILAINPIGSSLFGKSGYEDIAIPTMVISSSNDTAAPALLEQIRPFTWLQTTDKYLVLLQGGTHFSTIDASDASISNASAIPLPPSIVGPDPAIAFAYLERLGVAFFKAYVTSDSNYHPYLSAAYAREISRPLMPISVVRSLPLFELNTDNRKSP